MQEEEGRGQDGAGTRLEEGQEDQEAMQELLGLLHLEQRARVRLQRERDDQLASLLRGMQQQEEEAWEEEWAVMQRCRERWRCTSSFGSSSRSHTPSH